MMGKADHFKAGAASSARETSQQLVDRVYERFDANGHYQIVEALQFFWLKQGSRMATLRSNEAP